MDVYQILIIHNRPWSSGEIVAFLILLLVILCYEIELISQKKIYISQAVSFIILFVFLAIVFESTVLSRRSGTRKYHLEIFWSWKAIVESIGKKEISFRSELLKENLLNMILLFPVGVLLPIVMKRKISCKVGLFVGLGISICIESLQLILCRGYFEFDDIIHNAVGCMLGVLCMEKSIEKVRRISTRYR